MDSYILKFRNLATIEAYCEIQRYFMGFDHEGAYFERNELDENLAQVIKFSEPFNNPEIIFYSRGVDSEELYTPKKFEEDFLIPKINSMAKTSYKAFIRNIKGKGLYTAELIQGYTKDYNSGLNKTKNAISQSIYLSSEVQNLVLQEMDLLEELIQEFMDNPFPDLKQKIQFNWKRTDVIYFFHLLKKNKVIADISHADLGRIIDNAVEYYNEETNQYKGIAQSRKHLNSYWNTEGRPEEPANERLRTIFQDDDFYNH